MENLQRPQKSDAEGLRTLQSPTEKTLLTRVCPIFFGIAAIMAAAIACCPSESLRSAAAWVRRADDVSAERIARIRLVCGVSSAWNALFAIWLLAAKRFRLTSLLAAHKAVVQRQAKPIGSLGQAIWIGNLIAYTIRIGLLVLLALWFRLPYLNSPVDYDEAYSFVNYATQPWYLAISDYSNTNNHLLNSLLMHVSYRVWGQEEWALRLWVFLASLATIPVAYFWAERRTNGHIALVSCTFLACSPLLGYYSVNARGYLLVLLAALIFDDFLQRIADGEARPSLWLGAALTAALGFWAMPTMLYAVLGSITWFAISLLSKERDERIAMIRSAIGSGFLLGYLVFHLYGPAYVFRGTMAAENPFVHPLESIAEWAKLAPTAWLDGFRSWTFGPIPVAIWASATILGVFASVFVFPKSWRTIVPFFTTAAVMAVQRTAPPSRLFLFLAPWFFLIAASGIVWLMSLAVRVRAASPKTDDERLARTVWIHHLLGAGTWVVCGIVLLGTRVFLSGRPVLYDLRETLPAVAGKAPEDGPKDRWAVVSIPDVVKFVKSRQIAGEKCPTVLLVPLPCDLPFLYYNQKLHCDLPVNVRPKQGDVIWLVTQTRLPPVDTLSNLLVRPLVEDWNRQKHGRWTLVRQFPTLDLWSWDGAAE